jgi:aminopeptidase N
MCLNRLHRLASLEPFSGPGAEDQYPPDQQVEPVHLDIDLKVDVTGRAASGAVTVTATARAGGADRLTLDAISFLDVVVKDPDGHELSWRYDGEKIHLRWAKPLSLGEKRRVEVVYRIQDPVTGLFFMNPVPGDAKAASKESSAREPSRVQPSYAATDHETERARYWLPCVDLPHVRTTLDFHLTAEKRFTILANGALVGEKDHGDNTKTAHWRLEQPCPSYLICFAIGDFIKADDGEFDGIPVASFTTAPHEVADLKRSFGRTKDMLRWITGKLDSPFPFPKYYQFALPAFGGAMENISLVSWSDIFVADESHGREWGWFIDQVNIHEMAHSFFGDSVVCRDFAHAWLKESWATYMEQCWLEDRYGADDALADFWRNAQAYFSEADEKYRRPIVTRRFKSSWQMYDRHLYPGGACRLHMLRGMLGDQVFWGAVQDYVKTYRGRVVETDDFRRKLEHHSGRSLIKFFDQWIMGDGYPDLKVSFNWDEKTKAGTFTVEQKQCGADEGKSGGGPAPLPFAFETDVGWTVAVKDQATDQAVEHSVAVTIDRAHHDFVVPMPVRPEQVRFDPKCRALFKLEFNPGDDMLKAQLTGARDVIGRILAACELIKTGRASNIRAVGDAMAREPHWAVRCEVAGFFADSNTGAGLEAMVLWMKREADSRVLHALATAARGFRDPQIVDVVQARLKEALPPLCRGALIECLGAQREPALMPAVEREFSCLDRHGFVESAVFRALAEFRSDDAVHAAMNRIKTGKVSFRAIPAAAQAIGSLHRHATRPLQSRIAGELSGMLRDELLTVRQGAYRGIGVGGVIESARALEGLRPSLPLQERVEVERILDQIKKPEESKVQSLEKKLEALQDKFRKLEAAVQKIQDEAQK